MTEFFIGISCLKIFEFISTPQRLLNDAPQSLEFSVEEQKSYQVLQVQEVKRSKLIHVYFMFHDFRVQIIIFWFSLDLKSRCQVQLSRCLVRKPFEPKETSGPTLWQKSSVVFTDEGSLKIAWRIHCQNTISRFIGLGKKVFLCQESRRHTGMEILWPR